MTDTRHTADTITDDDLDELYADLDRYEEVQGEMNENAIDLARRAARAEATVARVQGLARLWLKRTDQLSQAGRLLTDALDHPAATDAEAAVARVQRLLTSGPIGTCCDHLVHAALHPSKEQH